MLEKRRQSGEESWRLSNLLLIAIHVKHGSYIVNASLSRVDSHGLFTNTRPKN